MNEKDFYRDLEKARGKYEYLRVIKTYSDGYEKDLLIALRDSLCRYLEYYIIKFHYEIIDYLTNNTEVVKKEFDILFWVSTNETINNYLEEKDFYILLSTHKELKDREHYFDLKLLLDNMLSYFIKPEDEFIAISQIKDKLGTMNFEAAETFISMIDKKISELYGKTEMPTLETKIIIPTSISTSTKIEKVTWKGNESDLLELFRTLKVLGKVEYNVDNDTELLPILKATFEGINSGVTWEGSENEFFELFKALREGGYTETPKKTDKHLFESLGNAMKLHIKTLGAMKQRNLTKQNLFIDKILKIITSGTLKQILQESKKEYKTYLLK
ncbi:hypothetical protein J4N46_10670 [Capnocytophaga sp. Marseille-Q4570]|uniref:Uncharacterized protein n=1 Tax=Capnocytophaga bilenii TaxID=2819369 RepID=A0ABS3Q083_9FLAO|nr:hypothetical protein [Capnocytophaga bilenii]MBO1884862.1 hypothetical protein [Capnocytophaga bilenii]